MSKTILITGSSRGIGSELVRYFAQKGYKTVITWHSSQNEAASLHKEIAASWDAKPLLIQCDVSDRGQVNRMFDIIAKEWGFVDYLVNNAGINIDGPFLEMTGNAWSRVINTVLTGTFNCSQEYAQRFQGEHGHIINLGATTAIRGRKNGANYCSAKAGVITLTKCLALELAPRIAVNCVIPGFIETGEVTERFRLDDPEQKQKVLEKIPLARIGRPEEIARTIYFLIAESTYITGQNIIVDGGNFM